MSGVGWIVDGAMVLPVREPEPKPLSFCVRGVYVSHAEGDNLPRVALVSDDCLTFELSDDWLTLDDLQSIADAIDIKFNRPIKALVMRHALRRAVIVLTDDRRRAEVFCRPDHSLVLRDEYSREITIHADRDMPARTIRVELETK